MQFPSVPSYRPLPSVSDFSSSVNSELDGSALQAARYQAWLQQSTESLCTIDRQGLLTSATPNFCRLLNTTPQTLIGKNLWDYFEQQGLEGGDRIRLAWQTACLPKSQPQILITYTVQNQLPIALQWHLQGIDLQGEIVEVQALVKVVDTLRNFPPRDSDSDQFRQLAAHLQQVFWVYDLALKRLVYVSPACLTVLGTSRTDCESRSFQDWITEIHPGDLQTVMKASRQPLRGQSVEVTYRMLQPDAGIRWLMTRAVPVRNDSGRIDRIVAMTEDVTERKQQESWLRLLESVIVNANDAVVITEAEPVELPGPHIVYVNQAFTRMMGYQPEEIVGKTPRILQGPNTDAATLQHLRSALKAWKPVLVEIINYHKNGSEIWIELSIFPVVDPSGRYNYWVAIQRDITQRKQAEAVFQQQAKRTEVLAELTLKMRRSLELPEILQTTVTEVRELFQVDRVLIFQRLGQGVGTVLSEATAAGSDRLLSQNIEESTFFPEPIQLYERSMVHAIDRLDDRQWQSRGAQFLQQMGVRSMLVIPVLQRETVWGWLIVHHGQPHRAWSNFETELLQQLMSPLEVAITHSLLWQTLQENNELKSHLVSTTSHEFRTPISTILSSADLLEFYGDRVTPDKQLEHIQRIQTAAVNMNNLLSDILLIERADSNRLKCVPEPIELRSFCQSLIAELSWNDESSAESSPESPPQSSLYTPSLTLQLEPDEPQVWADLDRTLLRQILSNLLSNALKYSPNLPEVQVQITVTSEGVEIQVSDRGIGIPKTDLLGLFEPFQRGSNVGNVPGNGLGMAIVKKSAEAHNGEVIVCSQEGEGTQVKVRLQTSFNCSRA